MRCRTRIRQRDKLLRPGCRVASAWHIKVAFKAMRSRTEEIGNPSEWAPGELDKVHLEIQQNRERFAEMRDGFGKAMDQLEEAVRSFDRKIELYEARSARIRKEIEAYFDKDG
jgi:hypothetical protein